MRKPILMLPAISIIFILCRPCLGAEHGGGAWGEHAGKEHGGAMISEPSANQIRSTMSDYVKAESKKTGTFDVYDEETGKTRELSLIRIHDRVGKTGSYYYSCADFKDKDTGETVDMDLDVKHEDGKLSVVDVRVHKVNGKERYTYDANDNRIPVRK